MVALVINISYQVSQSVRSFGRSSSSGSYSGAASICTEHHSVRIFANTFHNTSTKMLTLSIFGVLFCFCELYSARFSEDKKRPGS